MENIEIKINKETRMIDLTKNYLGNDGENLQGKLIFSFVDDFVNGQARLEYKIKDNKYYALLEKEDETYTLPIKSVLTKEGQIIMQLVITEGTDEEEVPIFKSNIFYLYCKNSVNAETPEPEEYPTWIEVINTKLNQIDTLDLDANRVEDGVVVSITKKDGSIKEVKVNDGQGGSGGTKDYEVLENKPSINDVELIGNKTLSDLGIDQDFVKDENYVHTDNNFADTYKNQIETNQNNIETLSGAIQEHDQEIQSVQNDIDTIEQDIDSLGTEIDNLDTNKQDKLVSGESIKTINNQDILGSGNIDISSSSSMPIHFLSDTEATQSNPLNISVVEPGIYYKNSGGDFRIKFIVPGTETEGNINISVRYSKGYVLYLFKKIDENIANQDRIFTYETLIANSNDSNKPSMQKASYYWFNNTAVYENVIITGVFLTTEGTQYVSGVKTFTALPKIEGSLTPTLNTHFTTKKYVDDAISDIFSQLIIELEEYQYTYDSYILPAIDVEQLREIYTKDSAGMPLTLHWSLYGSDNNFKIVSSDHISNEYSIDILVHNKYHCAYTWTDETTGIVNPDVNDAL